ncbi:hypothetical protein N0V90_005505 [Kalmusia sp. IMI 367209]|nr:hypothetical protein N0V90_005505 [Kalmusia sp. IMI 367209]
MSSRRDRDYVRDGKAFCDRYQFVKYLNEGAEGKISRWEATDNGQLVAVKEAVRANRDDLKREAQAFIKIGEHPNIVNFFGYDPHWPVCPPALFIEHADLGDVTDYRALIRANGCDVAEVTLWKFLSDITQALDWIHNHLDEPCVHGDLKPGNILVMLPPDYDGGGIPLLPTFKICDVARLQPARKIGPVLRFDGTPEFGPPMAERRARIAPSVDIYAIGASIQLFQLGIHPTMSKQDFIETMKKAGVTPLPTERELNDPNHKWRFDMPPLYRPLNMPKEYQESVLKLKWPKPPVSNAFNDWYSMTMEESPARRISAKTLSKYFIPVSERQVDLLSAKQIREAALQQEQETAATIEKARMARRQGREWKGQA